MTLQMLQDIPPWDWPEEAAETIRETLRSNTIAAPERLIAAELAGESVVSSDELAAVLLAICRDRDEPDELRGQAAISLGPALEHGDTMGFEYEDDVMLSETWFHRVQESLQKIYADAMSPDYVRRRVLEAAVRAPCDWQRDAVRAAYATEDDGWRVTAVFSMRFFRGFDREIVESLNSSHPEIHYQAVCAAGSWEIDEAWPHLALLLANGDTDKHLLVAAIDAVTHIRPTEAGAVLVDLTEAGDEDIVAAAHEAMAMAEVLAGQSEAGEDDDSDEDHLWH